MKNFIANAPNEACQIFACSEAGITTTQFDRPASSQINPKHG